MELLPRQQFQIRGYAHDAKELTLDLTQVAAWTSILALAAALIYTVRVVSRISDQPPPEDHRWWTQQDLRDLMEILDQNSKDIEGLTLALSEGILGYKRHEKRVQKTVTSARRLVSEAGLEHAGIEAEYEELRNGDDEPSRSDQVQLVPAEVARPTPTGIPGMNSDELDRLRGLMNV